MMKKLLHTPEGVRDIYNSECEKKLFLQENLHRQFHRYGYKDIQTPTFEFFDIFSREIGTIPSKDLYKFFDREGNTLVLRPDFTPSIARCAAKYYMNEDMPLRFCYAGNTFINNSEYQGKLKESTQMGAELIGDNTVDADAEMIALVIQSLLEAGLKDFQVEVGQVDFFKGILAGAGIEEETEQTLRELISIKNYFGVEELVSGLSVKEEVKAVLLKLPTLFGSIDILKEAKGLAENVESIQAVERLEKLYEVLSIYGLEQYISFDLGMLSKYNYYTGIIFKAYTYGTGEEIAKGGRYNELLTWFGKEAPSIGFVIMLDTLMSALMRQNIDIPVKHVNTVLLYKEAQQKPAIELALHLRANNENVELICMADDKTKKDYVEYGRRNQNAVIMVMESDEEVSIIDLEAKEI
ncbi:ATP phosphoribosyltransferase regulatory subunit [Konateibacter massiliensis]|uniref:ATP phosphoribosyltransferase regulatory subunit n=1 Tax=Konateibacter massiliensis TaxID=2002841 RepID=UPI000C160398|nr:ATP phosphoribosyltransferase regulatory subunit [Konateibacter massiliensis]